MRLSEGMIAPFACGSYEDPGKAGDALSYRKIGDGHPWAYGDTNFTVTDTGSTKSSASRAI